MGGAELTLFHDGLRVTLTVAYRAGDGGAMLFHQTGWDPVWKKGFAQPCRALRHTVCVIGSERALTGAAKHTQGCVCTTAASLIATVQLKGYCK